MKQILKPRRICASENVINAEAALDGKVKQVVLRSDEEWEKRLISVGGKGYIILDFGKEMNGGIRIICGGVETNATKIRIRFGESLSEASAELGGKTYATNDHSPRDFEAVLSVLSDVEYGKTGFRFVRIDFLEDKKVFLQNIFCVNRILNKKAVYRYNGTDMRVKRIFEAAKRTVDLCVAGDYVYDGIKRDRLVWIGDIHPEMLSLVTLYGRLGSIERSLEFVREQTPLDMWMNGIATYSMWWMIIVADYYFMTGCKAFAARQLGYIHGLIEKMDGHIGDDGAMDYPWYFVDWPTLDSDDSEAGVRAINIVAAKKAIKLFNEFGEDVSVAERLVYKLRKKPITVKKMKQVIGLKYFAEGALSDSDYAKLIDGGAKGMSTFMSYYILKAIASREPALAVSIMKEYYGAMLDVGATTFFEDFDIEWTKNASRIDRMPEKGQDDIHGDRGGHCYVGFRHSLCHGWSSGVIKFIKEYEDFIK